MKNHIAYLKYVLRHKRFVYQSGRITRAPVWRLLIHDWTKFLPSEWLAYVASFYNSDGTKRDWKSRTDTDKVEFDRAWNHHQKANKHHWQYWVLTTDSDEPRTKALPMPEKYIREMVADWMGAGLAITGRMEVIEWYGKNATKMLLHPRSRARVEELLKDVENYYRVGRMLGFVAS
jgi:hypothetical protein